jgi:asparagine synthase (glutamine-hydrolysing)
MCGIAGIIKRDSYVTEQEINSVTEALTHRGPDGSDIYLYGNVALGHRRLSIIDLEGGRQPLCNEDQTIWITFNGEIYNYRELKEQLVKNGHVFHTHSDTEVIVHAYEEWGKECVKKLRGMFAFAILDQRKQQVFLARDHFGIKPLVYGVSKGVFCFASEIQALMLVPELSLTISLKAIDQYLQFQYIPAPETICNEIRKLPPAHFMIVNLAGEIETIQPYWKFEFKPVEGKSITSWKEELEEVIKESVRAHLVSDVPFGAFLSGGIDSSLVVGMMAQQMQHPVKTFSIGFKEEKYNELEYARKVASYWATDHYEEIVEPDALAILPELVQHYGEPFGDSSAIPTWYVSRLAKRHVTMVLTGDAGDELFAGYQTYTKNWSRHLSPVPENLHGLKRSVYPFFHQLFPSRYPLRTATLKDWIKYIHYCDDSSRKSFWKPDVYHHFTSNNREFLENLFAQLNSSAHFQKVQSLDFDSYLPGDILAKVDIASMMHSLETRTPLLDIKVVEMAAKIPQHYNIQKHNGLWEGKLLLKKILGNHFPDSFLYRKKMGFSVPLDHWFGPSGANKNKVTERLLDSSGGLSDYFNKQSIEHIANGNNAGLKWLFLFLQEWLVQYKNTANR